jgi:hypothetical protein
MIDHEAPLTLTFGAILRVGIPVSILWIIGDAIDGEPIIHRRPSAHQRGLAPLSLLIDEAMRTT